MDRLDTLFAEAMNIAESTQRSEWLHRQCPNDPGLLAEALALVDSAASEARAQEEAASRRPVPAGPAGKQIGAYSAVRLLGSGGMGSVYLAERNDGEVRQTVAIKVLSAASAGEHFARYFQDERQILASLTHPNIARFLDGGSLPDGEPYLVMEYVDGQPLDRYQDSRALDIPARLRLFQKICGAVAFLHQSLILHRDLKPANILVTAEGEPKLLDFGAAKLTERLGQTQTLAPLTPRYASPEQFLGGPITTRGDVYSLGILLYESLTGAWPFGDPADIGASIERIAKNSPPRNPREVVTEAAARNRGQSRAGLERLLEGDIESIALKALAADPAERYESATALSDDLQRYLNSEPVQARRQTAVYRLRKFVRRNRGKVAAAAAMTLAILSTAGVAVWQARAARLSEQRAQRRFEDVRKLARLVLFDFHDEVAKLPGAFELQHKLIDQSLERFAALAKESAGDPELLAEVGEGYYRLGNVLGGLYASSRGDASKARKTYEDGLAAMGRVPPSSGSFALTRGRLLRALGRSAWATGDRAGWERHLQDSLATLEAAAKANPRSFDVQLELVNTNNNIADILFDSDPRRALTSYRRSAIVVAQLEQLDPERKRYVGNGILFYKQGACQEMLGNLPAAVDLYRAGLAENGAIPAGQRQAIANQRARASLLSVLGGALATLGSGQEAMRYLDESVALSARMAEADPANIRQKYSLAANLNNRNLAYRQLRLTDRLFAGRLQEQAVWNRILEKSDVDSYCSAAAMNLDALSQDYATRGDRAKALDHSRRALDLLVKVVAKSPNPEDRRRYASALLEGGAPGLRNPRLALEQMRLAMKQSQDPSEAAVRTFGLALLRNGLKAEAAAVLEKSLRILLSRQPGGGAGAVEATRVQEWLAEARR